MDMIAFDVDGTLINSWSAIRHGFNTEYGVDIPPLQYISTVGDLSEQDTHELCSEYVFKYFEHASPMPYVQEAMRWYSENNNNKVTIVTARDGSRNDCTLTQLKMHVGDYNYEIHNIMTKDKAKFCYDNGVVLFEDHPDVVQELHNMEVPVIKMRWPYNEHVKTYLSMENFEPFLFHMQMMEFAKSIAASVDEEKLIKMMLSALK